MKKYRVTIWTSVDVEAEDSEEASDLAQTMFVRQEIKNNEFFFEPEEN
jgi:hypothetical protein